MRFGHIELFCSSPDRTRAFYVDGLGFELAEEQPGGFHWLNLGPIELLLRPEQEPSLGFSSYASTAPAMVFYVDDLASAIGELAAKGISPADQDGPGCPTFRDPDGRWIQIVENSKA